ncbi:MAG: phospholipase A [Granulosicoccus sp.]|nr:phospholipase A [Granulosicoccus sp.]
MTDNSSPVPGCSAVFFSCCCALLLGACTSAGRVQDGRIDLPDAADSAVSSPAGEVPEEDDTTGTADAPGRPSGGLFADSNADTAAQVSNGVNEETAQEQGAMGVVTERVREEREEAFNPYVLTAHKHNFILPVSYTNGINEQIYQQNDVPLREGLQPAEVKFQISLKSQLNEQDLFLKDDSLSLGITLEAWWQLYSSDLSSPFRETNYQPEIFYLVPLLWGPFGGNTAVALGLEHQSNGQVQGLSRSWNRVYAALIYERGAFVASIRPWYRLPEKAKEQPGDAEGDDNPDILDYMGHGEAAVSWRNQNNEFAVRIRANPSTGKGALTLGWTFPFFAKFRGFVQFFDGYGDSLIDYNHYQQRLGLGVALTNIF